MHIARAGALLGGPLAPSTLRRRGCRTLAEADLLYLRSLSRTNPEARLMLDQPAGQLTYGSNRIAIVVDSPGVAGNVIRAITGLTGRLPAKRED